MTPTEVNTDINGHISGYVDDLGYPIATELAATYTMTDFVTNMNTMFSSLATLLGITLQSIAVGERALNVRTKINNNFTLIDAEWSRIPINYIELTSTHRLFISKYHL